MVFIYILKCRANKYYVGKTSNPSVRLTSHFNEGGSAWTKLYKPTKVLNVITGCSKYDEDKIVLEYMEKYGIENVRGGTYSQINLVDEQILSITKQMISANDLCQRCMRTGHFIKDCYAKTNIYGDHISNRISDKEMWEYCFDKFTSHKKAVSHEKICELSFAHLSNDDQVCYRCGRQGHCTADCYAKTNIHGDHISNRISSDKKKVLSCYRCGRKGHCNTGCYAIRHTKGYYLSF
jgi:hypothetical protein